MLYLHWPFGHAMEEPQRAEQHRAVLRDLDGGLRLVRRGPRGGRRVRKATAEALHRRAIAGRIVQAFDRHAPPRAVLLPGSAGDGSADDHSDLDLLAYYDRLPDPAAVERWRAALGVPHPAPRQDSGWSDTFTIDGVECQAGGMLVAAAERYVSDLLAGREPGSAVHQKVAQGLLDGLALRDGGLIAGWRARLAEFPDALAEAMAAHHLGIFPYWSVWEHIAHRDARLWEVQSLLEGAFHVVGTLSAANRRYFTSFQFKRMRQHLAGLEAAPPGLAERLESLFALERPAAARELRLLVAEAVEVVERRLPRVDTTAIRNSLGKNSPG
jgi:hypothetical protein